MKTANNGGKTSTTLCSRIWLSLLKYKCETKTKTNAYPVMKTSTKLKRQSSKFKRDKRQLFLS